jgi:hypothetical protein
MRYLCIFTTAVLLAQPSPASAQFVGDPVALVDSWYRMYLGRSALNDPASAGWINLLRQGGSPASVLAGILGSPEYFNRVGGTMPAFVTAVYRDVVGRPPTPGELNFWLRRAFTQSPREIATEILAQNPGAGMITTLPGVVAPPTGVFPASRDRWPRREDFDFRRPVFPYRW